MSTRDVPVKLQDVESVIALHLHCVHGKLTGLLRFLEKAGYENAISNINRLLGEVELTMETYPVQETATDGMMDLDAVDNAPDDSQWGQDA